MKHNCISGIHLNIYKIDNSQQTKPLGAVLLFYLFIQKHLFRLMHRGFVWRYLMKAVYVVLQVSSWAKCDTNYYQNITLATIPINSQVYPSLFYISSSTNTQLTWFIPRTWTYTPPYFSIALINSHVQFEKSPQIRNRTARTSVKLTKTTSDSNLPHVEFLHNSHSF